MTVQLAALAFLAVTFCGPLLFLGVVFPTALYLDYTEASHDA